MTVLLSLAACFVATGCEAAGAADGADEAEAGAEPCAAVDDAAGGAAFSAGGFGGCGL